MKGMQDLQLTQRNKCSSCLAGRREGFSIVGSGGPEGIGGSEGIGASEGVDDSKGSVGSVG